jgi:hypothetical protein
MPTQRDYEIWIHAKPAKKVAVNGTNTTTDYDPAIKAARIAVQEDPARKAAIRIQYEL